MCWYKVQSERVSVTQYQQYFNVCFLLYFVDMLQQFQKRKQIGSMDRSSCMIHVLYLRHYPAAFGEFIADLARERQHETCFSFYLSTFDFMVHENILFEYHLTCCHKITIHIRPRYTFVTHTKTGHLRNHFQVPCRTFAISLNS